jgi:hypothetical protein
MPSRDGPGDERDLVADAAMEMIREQLDVLGLTPQYVFVSFVVEEEKKGNNSVSAGWAKDEMSDRDVFSFFLSHTISMGKAIGIKVAVVPMKEFGHD